jgi:small subunit ribosomal protein S21
VPLPNALPDAAQVRKAQALSAGGRRQKNAIDARPLKWPISYLFHRTTFVHDMSIEIKIRKNEPIDRALRRMKKKLDRENIIRGTRAKRYYEKPCEKRRRKDKVSAFTAMLRARYAN